ERTGLFRMPFVNAFQRAAGLPRSVWGTVLAHFGIGVTLFGIVCETNWSSERIVALRPSETVRISGYDLRFDGTSLQQRPNYRQLLATFTVARGGDVIGTMQPAKRNFPARNSATTEAALMTRGLSQLYVSPG